MFSLVKNNNSTSFKKCKSINPSAVFSIFGFGSYSNSRLNRVFQKSLFPARFSAPPEGILSAFLGQIGYIMPSMGSVLLDSSLSQMNLEATNSC